MTKSDLGRYYLNMYGGDIDALKADIINRNREYTQVDRRADQVKFISMTSSSRLMKLLSRERSSIAKMSLIGRISVILPQLEALIMVLLKMAEQMEDIAIRIQRR